MSESNWPQFVPPCEAAGASTKRTPKFRGAYLRVETLEADLVRTVTMAASFPGQGGALLFSLRGAILYRLEPDSGWRLAAPQSATFIQAPASHPIRVAKGDHEVLIVTWPNSSMPILETWLQRRLESGTWSGAGTHPIHPFHGDKLESIQRAIAENSPMAEQTIAAAALELAAALTLADNVHSLAAIPQNLPEIMMRLVLAVRGDPSRSWPLKEASDFVGYSPFHFSRIFKAQVGMGFHEFVDRTRTEMAVQLLTTTESPIDLIASDAGFGTSQGLRESVKEYLGLVPSELRFEPGEGIS